MFNQTFMFLATLFGAKVRCIKPVVQKIEMDGEVRSFDIYSEGDILTVKGILQNDDGLFVFLREEGAELENDISLETLQKHFALHDKTGFRMWPAY